MALHSRFAICLVLCRPADCWRPPPRPARAGAGSAPSIGEAGSEPLLPFAAGSGQPPKALSTLRQGWVSFHGADGPTAADACAGGRNSTLDTENLNTEPERFAENPFENSDAALKWHLSGAPFLTDSGPLIDATVAAISDTCGVEPALSTGGGTSDGRFISPAGAAVVEVGPVNASIHKVDEHVRAADVVSLTHIYQGILERLLGSAQ